MPQFGTAETDELKINSDILIVFRSRLKVKSVESAGRVVLNAKFSASLGDFDANFFARRSHDFPPTVKGSRVQFWLRLLKDSASLGLKTIENTGIRTRDL